MTSAGKTIRLRPATPDDLPLLRRWDEQPHVINADPNDDWGYKVVNATLALLRSVGAPCHWRYIAKESA